MKKIIPARNDRDLPKLTARDVSLIFGANIGLTVVSHSANGNMIYELRKRWVPYCHRAEYGSHTKIIRKQITDSRIRKRLVVYPLYFVPSSSTFMKSFYTELYYDKIHDEVVVLDEREQLVIGFNKVMLSMEPADFFSFEKTVQAQNVFVTESFSRIIHHGIIEIPERGLKFILDATELKRLRKMLQLSTDRLKKQLLIREFNREVSACAAENDVTIYSKRHRYLVGEAIKEMSKAGFQKDYNIVSLAKRIGSNETTLKQAFKSIMTTTIYKFYQDKRMAFATQRLKCGETITDVSCEIGYSTVGHFSHAFKKHFGVCPRNYSKVV